MTYRNKKLNIAAAALLALLLVLSCLAFPAQVRAANNGEAVLTVSQQLLPDDTDDTAFTYELRAVTPGAPLPEGAEGGVFAFTIGGTQVTTRTIRFEAEGEYLYTLRCAGEEGTDAYEADTNEFIVRGVAQNEAEGLAAYLFVHEKGPDGTPGAKINPDPQHGGVWLFTHEKKYGGEIDPFVAVDPPVKKRITGNKPAKDDEFRFRLYAREWPVGLDTPPMPEGSTGREKVMSVFGQGEEEFGVWEYRVPGTYIYEISEINTEDPNYIYDTHLFTITDEVQLEDDALTVHRTVVSLEEEGGRVVQDTLQEDVEIRSRSDERTFILEFTNTYLGEGSDDGGGGDDGGDDGGDTPDDPGNDPDDPGGPGDNSGGNPGSSDGGSGSGTSSGKAGSVKTGDSSQPWLWWLLIALATAGLVIARKVSKRGSGTP